MRALTMLKEWKEIIVLLAAVSGLYVATPRAESHESQQVSQETAAVLVRLTHTVDSMNARIGQLSTRIDALVRIQCAQSDRRALTLAGVNCP